MNKCLGVGFTVLAVTLAGCSGVKVYSNQLVKNVDITATTKSDSILRGERAFLDVYSMDARCQTVYE